MLKIGATILAVVIALSGARAEEFQGHVPSGPAAGLRFAGLDSRSATSSDGGGTRKPTAGATGSELRPCPTRKSAVWTNCFGRFTFDNGERYAGEWLDDKFSGHGVYTFPDGETYEGEYRNGKRDGQGTLTFPNGETYVGQFRNGERHGHGTYTFRSGETFEGEYVNGKRNGPGTEYRADHRVARTGVWRDGTLVSAGTAPATPAAPVTPVAPVAPAAPADTGAAGASIRLIHEQGTYKVPVLINGVVSVNFTVDSGAADVSIPSDVVRALMRKGTLTEKEFEGEQTYVLADGSEVRSRTFRARQLKVGNRVIENVLCSVAGENGDLLLGQSFLSRFKKVSFDYSRQTLVLE